jgi:hypothetical protein
VAQDNSTQKQAHSAAWAAHGMYRVVTCSKTWVDNVPLKNPLRRVFFTITQYNSITVW